VGEENGEPPVQGGAVDTHCHLFLMEDEPAVAVEAARASGVERLICVGVDVESSRQSLELADRSELDARVAEARERFADGDVPLPPFWGGYRVVPETIELWTHRDDRLHERVRYERDGGGWRRALLAP